MCVVVPPYVAIPPNFLSPSRISCLKLHHRLCWARSSSSCHRAFLGLRYSQDKEDMYSWSHSSFLRQAPAVKRNLVGASSLLRHCRSFGESCSDIRCHCCWPSETRCSVSRMERDPVTWMPFRPPWFGCLSCEILLHCRSVLWIRNSCFLVSRQSWRSLPILLVSDLSSRRHSCQTTRR